MYMEGHWFSCHIRQEDRTPEDPVADLDVSILQNKLLGPVLGIRDPKTDGRIDFVGGIRGMDELVRRSEEAWAEADAINPKCIAVLLSEGVAGVWMAAKSTGLETKLRSGLFIHEI